MRKMIIVVIILLLIIVIFDLIKMFALKDFDQIKVGKQLVVVVDKNDIVDYHFFENYDIWDLSETIKMKDFMKRNNLKLKPGKYVFNQAYKYEKVKEIFKFEKIE